MSLSLHSRRPRLVRSPDLTSSRSTSACCRRSKRSRRSIITRTLATPTIPTSTRWPRRPMPAKRCARATTTRNWPPRLRLYLDIPMPIFSPEHAKWLLDKKTELKKQLAGTAYFDTILDKINIESSVANRAMMPDYLDQKRFPGSSSPIRSCGRSTIERETARNPDEGVYIPLQEKMLHRWMQQENVSKLPATFADYLKFISQVLEDNSNRGGIAMKFEVAYFRPTTFGDPSRAQAEDIYQRYRERMAFQPKGNTAPFRTSFSATSFRKAGVCTCRCTFTLRSASAIISTYRKATS